MFSAKSSQSEHPHVLSHWSIIALTAVHLSVVRYARKPGSILPPWEGDEEATAAVEREAMQTATFDSDDNSGGADSDEDEPAVVLQLPDGRQVALPPQIFQQMQHMPPAEALAGILAMINGPH